jgi:hypothetical protein
VRKTKTENKRDLKRLCLENGLLNMQAQVEFLVVGMLVNRDILVAKKQKEREVAEPKRVAVTVRNNRFYTGINRHALRAC